MPDEVKIPVRTPGAAQARQELSGVAAAEQKVGHAGRRAGKETKEGADQAKRGLGEMGGAVDDVGRRFGLNLAALMNWKLAAVAAVAAVVEGVRRALRTMREFNREMRGAYREFVELTRQPQTGALAQLRGEQAGETVKWMHQMAQEYTIAPTEAREAAFIVESGLQELGPEGMKGLQADIFQAMRGYRAPGEAMGTLAIAARQAGLAYTRPQFQRFFAKSARAAETSKVTLGVVADIASQLLPAAVAAGIDPDYFLSMIAAMSFRIPEPGRLRTAVEQFIRAAGVPSEPLAGYAQQLGRPPTAAETMEFQGRLISEATRRGGPQGRTAMAAQLGVPAEIAQVYAAAFDPEVQRMLHERQRALGGVTWKDTVAARYQQVRGTPESREYASRMGAKLAEQQAGGTQAAATEIENWAKGEAARRMAAGEDISGVWESIAGKGAAAERLTQERMGEMLWEISQRKDVGGDVQRQARRLAFEMRLGADASVEARAGALIQINYIGGSHTHGVYKDPAGRPVERMAP